jgi:heme A synthase
MSAVHALEVRTRVTWLIAVSLAQGLVGFVQYFTQLPVVLVGAHMLGSCLVWIAALSVWSSTFKRPPVDGIARMVELAKSQPRVKAQR